MFTPNTDKMKIVGFHSKQREAMIIDMRTRLPHTHLSSRVADINFHAQQFARATRNLSEALEQLRALDMAPLIKALEASR